jgi:hypothetical protein
MIPNNKISTYDSYLQKMNIQKRSDKILNLSSSFKFKSLLPNAFSPSLEPTPSPTSILFSNRMRKYKEDHNILPIRICLEDNVEWEIPAFVIVTDSSILGHKRIYSSIEKKLKMDDQDNIVYNMLSSSLDDIPPRATQLKREFSIVYEPYSVTINSEKISFSRLSYAKIADYCSLNYPKSVKRAYKQLSILWTKHIQEYPEYWEGFDIKYIKRIYNNELGIYDEEFEHSDSGYNNYVHL